MARVRGEGQRWLLPMGGDSQTSRMVDVVLGLRTPHLYTYAVPEELVATLRLGAKVRVPHGRKRTLEGWAVRWSSTTWTHTHKNILEITDPEPLAPEPLLELALWMADYYCATPIAALEAIAPKALRERPTRAVRWLQAAPETPGPLTPRQRALVDALGAGEMRRSELLTRANASAAVLRTLVRRGVILETVRRVHAQPAAAAPPDAADAPAFAPAPEDEYALTAAQHTAITRIAAAAGERQAFRVFVVFGAPGSGKTEVYVRAIRAAVAAHRQAILLVPEIALATQTVERLARRFARVAVLHSQLAPAARLGTLRRIERGEFDVVIGTRTAVFAPCPRLGLIVVDEEQETGYKNLAMPYYHARDVAIKRAQASAAAVVLGSATPSLETWHNATRLPHYELLRLPERAPGAAPPKVHVERVNPEIPPETRPLLMPRLAAAIPRVLAEGGQVILLHNRRGYAAALRCEACGLVVTCTRCGAALVYHRADRRLKCHRCERWSSPPAGCVDATCGGRLKPGGMAIQRLEEELRRLVPAARLVRLDSDTMRRRVDYETALRSFARGEAEVMIGTQMVAKGLDFVNVRLVGVIDADAAMSLPHFRAAEQTMQLLVQVVGRAGRREAESEAIVQTGPQAAELIELARRGDYEAFADAELKLRQELGFPPAKRWVRIVCSDPQPKRARLAAEGVSERLRLAAGRVNARIRVDAAEPCVIAKQRDRYRYQVIVRAPREAPLHAVLRDADPATALRAKVERLTVDVDPLELL